MKKIAFIGAGNMGGALVMGICKAIDPQQVVIFDLNTERTAFLAEKTGCTVAQTAHAACADSEYIVLAVKPQQLRNVQALLIPAMKEAKEKGINQKILSIAAGITLESLSEIPLQYGFELPVFRMLPNTPSEIGEGLNIYAENVLATDEMCAELENMFAQCGLTERVTEQIIDVASAVSGCTPAFAYMFIDALADGAVASGMPRKMAYEIAAQATLGAAKLMRESGEHPGILKDMVCSPGGTTIQGMRVLENGGVRGSIMAAIDACVEKSKNL